MLVLLFVALWFILRGDLLYVFPCVILFLCFSVLLVLQLPRLGKRELILVPFVRLYVCSVCACLDLSVSSSSWGLGRAAFCDCGTPWTFLLPFLTNVYGSSAPSYAQVKFWVGEFKRSRKSLEDETRSGRPSGATDEEMCNKVRDLVYSDRRIKMEEIANAIHISHGSISTTLLDRLGMHKLTARWVPKSLSDKQMATRSSVYSALLKWFRSKEDDFLSCLVTVDETWVNYYESENKAQSRQSVGPGFLRPKKFKTQPSAGKVMAAVFWDAQGLIMLDFLAKKSTITGAYYANLLD